MRNSSAFLRLQTTIAFSLIGHLHHWYEKKEREFYKNMANKHQDWLNTKMVRHTMRQKIMDEWMVKRGEGLHNCKCGLCQHDVRVSCIEGKCYCCDLEDMFALLTQQEFEPQSKFVTEQRLKDALTC